MAPSESSENLTMTITESPRPLFVPETKRERLSDEELGNLLSAFGNNEAKAVTLVAMKNGTIYTDHNLHSELMDVQGDIKGWNMAGRGPFQFCQYSFENIGLVARGVTDQVQGTWGYIKTDYGEEQGNALAGLLLDFSLRHPEISLYDIFSATISPYAKNREIETTVGVGDFKNRSPFTRLKIIWELATTDKPIGIFKLEEAIDNKYHSISSSHLRDLKARGLINFEYPERLDNNIIRYQLAVNAPTESPHKPRRPALTKFIYELLSNDPNKTWTRDSLNVAYTTKKKLENPDFVSNEGNIKVYKGHISSVLSYLENEGYLYRPEGFSTENRSFVWVDEGQRLLFIDLLTLIDQFQNQDPDILRRGRMLAGSFSSVQISTFMAKAKEHSPWANNVSKVETSRLVLDFLSEHTNSTIKEICDFLMESQKRRLSKNSVNEYLRELRLEGKTKVSREKGIGSMGKWSLASSSDT